MKKIPPIIEMITRIETMIKTQPGWRGYKITDIGNKDMENLSSIHIKAAGTHAVRGPEVVAFLIFTPQLPEKIIKDTMEKFYKNKTHNDVDIIYVVTDNTITGPRVSGNSLDKKINEITDDTSRSTIAVGLRHVYFLGMDGQHSFCLAAKMEPISHEDVSNIIDSYNDNGALHKNLPIYYTNEGREMIWLNLVVSDVYLLRTPIGAGHYCDTPTIYLAKIKTDLYQTKR